MVYVDAGPGDTGNDSISVFRLSHAEPAAGPAVIRGHDVPRCGVFRPVVCDDTGSSYAAHAFGGDIVASFRANVDRTGTRPAPHGHDQRLLGTVIRDELPKVCLSGRWLRQPLVGCTLFSGRALLAPGPRGFRKARAGKSVTLTYGASHQRRCVRKQFVVRDHSCDR
jgi:hypothetical protein